jgi:hypothetical protein
LGCSGTAGEDGEAGFCTSVVAGFLLSIIRCWIELLRELAAAGGSAGFG